MNEPTEEELLPNMVSAPDEEGVRERFARETFLFAKHGRLRMKEFSLDSIISYIETSLCKNLFASIYPEEDLR